jgi:menaquinone-dependent protoporphyrinogen oxidase
MHTSVLIAYATRSGSTGEVARFMGEALRDAGIPNQVLPMAEVGSLDGNAALILGAPLYIGRFPKEFHRFLRFHRRALSAMRPWCFVLGPTQMELKHFESSRNQAIKQLNRYPWLHLADLHIFGGRWDPHKLPLPFSLVRRFGTALNKIPAMDIRDWRAMREWATGIAQQA